MRAAMQPRRCLALLAALMAALLAGPGAAAEQHAGGASGLPVHRHSAEGIAVEGMLEEDGHSRRLYSCPARFIRMGNSCYFLSRTMASWHDAHFRCRSMAAQLAAFEKRSENFHMRKHLMREEMAPVARWIGGIYQWEKRFWMWGSSGLPVAYKAFPRRMVTRDWAWHCIAMDPTSDFRWRPVSCLHAKHYICETPLRRSRTPARPGEHAELAGTKQRKGPRRKGDEVLVDKELRGGAPTAAPGHAGNASTTVPPGTRRLDDRRPTAAPRTRVGAVLRHHHAGRPRAPAPPPGPRRPGRRRLQPIDIYPILRKEARAGAAYRPRPTAAAAPAPRRPQQSHGYGDGEGSRPRPQPPRRLPEMPDATVQTLYPPPVAQHDNNDISNDV